MEGGSYACSTLARFHVLGGCSWPAQTATPSPSRNCKGCVSFEQREGKSWMQWDLPDSPVLPVVACCWFGYTGPSGVVQLHHHFGTVSCTRRLSLLPQNHAYSSAEELCCSLSIDCLVSRAGCSCASFWVRCGRAALQKNC